MGSSPSAPQCSGSEAPCNSGCACILRHSPEANDAQLVKAEQMLWAESGEERTEDAISVILLSKSVSHSLPDLSRAVKVDGILWSQQEDYMGVGDAIVMETMTIEQAKIRSLTSGGCRGFSIQGKPHRDGTVQVMFNATWNVFGEGWTSYRRLFDLDCTSQHPVFRFQDSGLYSGQWKGKLRHGFGMQRWADGSVYEGQWLANGATGRGRIKHANGDTYIGEWFENKAHGLGTYHHHKGTMTYAGLWSDDCQNGLGVEMWNTGSGYQGVFDKGLKHGVGAYSWPDGSLYQGMMFANNLQGYGTFIGAAGCNCNGEWCDGVTHGIGKLSWADGREYAGQFDYDNQHGFGIFSWPEGCSYKGYWRSGEQHGQGCYKKVDGTIVSALWERGSQIQIVRAVGPIEPAADAAV